MRLFIAIELKDRVKDELCMIQKRIKLSNGSDFIKKFTENTL